MSSPYKNEVARALFYVSVAKEKLESIKERVRRDALPSMAARFGEETPEDIASGLEKAVYADIVFKALLGFEMISTRLEIIAKLHGSLEVHNIGPISGFASIQIKEDSDLTIQELALVMPRASIAGPIDLLVDLLAEADACQCDECRKAP